MNSAKFPVHFCEPQFICMEGFQLGIFSKCPSLTSIYKTSNFVNLTRNVLPLCNPTRIKKKKVTQYISSETTSVNESTSLQTLLALVLNQNPNV